MAHTPVDFTFGSLVNFAQRQYLLTRVYAPRLFWVGLGMTSLYVAGLAGVWWGLVRGLFEGVSSRGWWGPAAVMVAVFVVNQWRANERRSVIGRAFGGGAVEGLRVTLRWDRWGTPVWMTLHWLLMLRSAFGRTMRWRGIRYRLHGPQWVERLEVGGFVEGTAR
jgi:hypothetical protein